MEWVRTDEWTERFRRDRTHKDNYPPPQTASTYASMMSPCFKLQIYKCLVSIDPLTFEDEFMSTVSCSLGAVEGSNYFFELGSLFDLWGEQRGKEQSMLIRISR